MLPHCLYGYSYEKDSTGCNIVDEKNKLIYVLEQENTNLKQALNEIRDKIVNIPNYRELHYFDGILQIIDKYTKEDD